MKELIHKTYKTKNKRGWDRIYIAIDIHDTILKANYKPGEICTDFFPKAKEVLQRLSKRKDCTLILYTCSHQDELLKYEAFFAKHKIKFNYVNTNPEVESLPGLGCFERKFYFNILLEDKANFKPNRDWELIDEAFDEVDIIEKFLKKNPKIKYIDLRPVVGEDMSVELDGCFFELDFYFKNALDKPVTVYDVKGEKYKLLYSLKNALRKYQVKKFETKYKLKKVA